MKPIFFDKRSIHFRLATVYGKLDSWDVENGSSICKYVKFVVKGFIETLLIAGFVGLVLGSIVDFSIWALISSLIISIGDPSIFGMIGGIFLIGPLVVLGIFGGLTLMEYIDRKRCEKDRESKFHNPSFIGLAFKSFKNKVCFKVNFK